MNTDPHTVMEITPPHGTSSIEKLGSNCIKSSPSRSLPLTGLTRISERDAKFQTLIAELSVCRSVGDAELLTHLHMFRLYLVLQTWVEKHLVDATVVGDLFGFNYNRNSGFLALRENEEIENAETSADRDEAAVLKLQLIDNSVSRLRTSMSV